MKKVIVYTAPNCLESEELKKYLKNRRIDYIEKDITTNEEYLEEYQRLDAGGTPIIVIKDEEDERWTVEHSGFNEDVRFILDNVL